MEGGLHTFFNRTRLTYVVTSTVCQLSHPDNNANYPCPLDRIVVGLRWQSTYSCTCRELNTVFKYGCRHRMDPVVSLAIRNLFY